LFIVLNALELTTITLRYTAFHMGYITLLLLEIKHTLALVFIKS